MFRHLDLANEPVGTETSGQFGAQDFDGHLAVVLQVLRQIHRSHPAVSQLALEVIVIAQGFGEPSRNVGHGAPNGEAPNITLQARYLPRTQYSSDSRGFLCVRPEIWCPLWHFSLQVLAARSHPASEPACGL